MFVHIRNLFQLWCNGCICVVYWNDYVLQCVVSVRNGICGDIGIVRDAVVERL